MNHTVVEWAREVLARNAVVLDTETTGFVPGKIVDIAIIKAVTGEPLVDTLVNPLEPIPEGASKVHGITDDMVKDAPTFADILGQVQAVLDAYPCVIFNVGFDASFLRAEGVVTEGCTLLCAMEQARYFYGSKRYALQYACGVEKIDAGQAHRARSDAEATRLLFHAWAAKMIPGEDMSPGA